ncbi:hypothetical protein RVB2_58270 [Pseudomonas aeruginosa]|nr:hypothetical protein RVB2_58270 [Pseudomonas aeruginosa]
MSVGIDDEPAFLHERVAQSDGLAAGIFLGHVPRGLQGNPVNMVAYQNTAFLKAPSRPLDHGMEAVGSEISIFQADAQKALWLVLKTVTPGVW